ncbi:MAG: hypothetical protein J6V01_06255, partial [Clostridia bacterium]|nr:hypothetical protein [Clostridia bacterium]
GAITKHRCFSVLPDQKHTETGAVKKVGLFLQPRNNRGRETAIFARALRFLLQKQYKTQN